MKMKAWILMVLAFFTVLGCSVDQTQEGELPEVDMDYEEGNMPEYDVDAADVDVDMEEETITVPDVDVETEEKTITVPDLDITMPDDEVE